MILAADIGGTTMRVAIGSADGEIHDMQKLDTPSSFEEGVSMLARAMDELWGEQDVEHVVVGIAGVLDRQHRSLVWSPHLTDWEGKDLAGRLEEALSLPVTIENDAALGALGEAVRGAGSGSPIVAYIAIGTGIGGARIVDGAIDRSAYGFEIGHQYLGVGVEFEELVSGTAVESAHGMAAKDVTDPAVWKEYAERFSIGLYNTLLHWSPDTVVLGGSLMRESGMHIEDIARALHAINKAIPRLPEIRHAALEYPGIVGALILTDS
jgi:predicted NBD/HSP70 family sugar kinase